MYVILGTVASVKTIIEVAAVQKNYADSHKAHDWNKKAVEEALYDPNEGISEAIRKLAEVRNFKENTTNKIIQVAILGSGVVLVSKIFKLTRSSTIIKLFVASKIISCLDTIETEMRKLGPMFQCLKFLLSGGGGQHLQHAPEASRKVVVHRIPPPRWTDAFQRCPEACV